MIDPLVADDPLEPTSTSAAINGVRISSRIIPAGGALRGGDWCEAFAVSEDVVALSIGDVCGHGIEKFAAMFAIRGAIRDAALDGLDPAQTLAQVNQLLYRRDPGEIATAILALLDTRQRSMIYANAGHPPPLVAGPHGTLLLEYPEPDLPLGIVPDFMPAIHALSLPAATLLVFYTDGVSESERDSVQGTSRLLAAATFARDFPDLPTAETIEALTLSTASHFDDAAILTARMPLLPITRNRHATANVLHVTRL
jgi:serine phosphatase RsbU (regulator of sigma subunit)